MRERIRNDSGRAGKDRTFGKTPCSDPELLSLDCKLLDVIGTVWAEGSRRSGDWLKCRPGCFECCLGPFPVSLVDAWRMTLGLKVLEATDPGSARAVWKRAAESVVLLRSACPGILQGGVLAQNETDRETLFEKCADLPCPVLEPGSGRCLVYEYRPLSCRTYGLPVRCGLEDLEPCHLCFREASAGDVEKCRVEFGAEDIEKQILLHLTGAPGDDPETLIACVILDFFSHWSA